MDNVVRYRKTHNARDVTFSVDDLLYIRVYLVLQLLQDVGPIEDRGPRMGGSANPEEKLRHELGGPQGLVNLLDLRGGSLRTFGGRRGRVLHFNVFEREFGNWTRTRRRCGLGLGLRFGLGLGLGLATRRVVFSRQGWQARAGCLSGCQCQGHVVVGNLYNGL